MKESRNINLDLMRFLGVLIIMVAHASPPGWIYQLRNFGTPLLIVASALTYSVVYSNRSIVVGPFLKKRLIKLILPAWIFLVFGFSLAYLICLTAQVDYPFSSSEIIDSFLFYDGIGFVWVFKVYIILALLTPMAIKMSQSGVSNRRYFLMLLLVYISYEVIFKLAAGYIPAQYLEFFSTTVFVVFPYSVLYFYGMRLPSLSNFQLISVIVLSLFIFLALMIFKYLQLGEFVPTQVFKYPPRLYYLSYAFFALNTVYLVVRHLSIQNSVLRTMVLWLSSHSLWIYLWHIFGFFIWRLWLVDFVQDGMIRFLLNAIFLLLFGIIMTYLQSALLAPLKESKYIWRRRVVGLLT